MTPHDDHGRSADFRAGYQVGLAEYRPNLFAVNASLEWTARGADHTLYLFCLIGSRAASLGFAVTDHREFYEGAAAGVRAAAIDWNHADSADCSEDEPFGRCDYCTHHAAAVAESLASKRRWEAQLNDPDRSYVVGGSGSMVHTRDCRVAQQMTAGAEGALADLTPAMVRHGQAPVRWPEALTREQASQERRRRCRVCSPDLLNR